MRNENLRTACEDIGLRNVATVISSGNVVFETASDDLPSLESTLEATWQQALGFESTTIIRTQADLERLVEFRPFGELEHRRESYLLVTFAKSPLKLGFQLPYRPPSRDYHVPAATEYEIFTVTDTTKEKTPDVMAWVERQFGKDITSRTWLTVGRILNKMS